MRDDLTQTALEELARAGHDALWWLTLDWPAGPQTCAHRPVSLHNGEALPPLLATPGRLRVAPASGWGPAARRAVSRLDVTLLLDGPEIPSLRQRLAVCDPEGLEVTWGLLLLPAGGQPSFSDAIPLFRGVIERATVTRATLELQCLDTLSARSDKRFGHEIAPNELPTPDSPIEGHMPPWIFGNLEAVELVPWRVGLAFTLARDASPDDTTLTFVSLDGLPDTGVLQIDDERLKFSHVDRANHSIGLPDAPLRRTEPTWHDAGSIARLVPPNGFEWLVAAHPCLRVDNLQADGLPVVPEAWSLETEPWNGETLQKVVLPEWPTAVSYQTAPSTLLFNGVTHPDAWELDALSTALNGIRAIDNQPEQTAATLNSTARLLRVRFREPLAAGARRYGVFETARLRLRVEASGYWEASTRLSLRFLRGEQAFSISLPRPPLNQLQVTLPGHTHGLELAVSSPQTINLRYGPVLLDLDLTEAASPSEGWTWLDGAGATPIYAEVCLETGGDPVEFSLWDLALEITCRPRRRVVMASTLTAAVAGFHEEGILLDNPADLVRFFLCDSRGLGLASDRLDLVSFSAAGAQLAALGYRFSNRLEAPQAIGALLSRLLYESRSSLTAWGGKLTLSLEETGETLPAAEPVLDVHALLARQDLRLDRVSERQVLKAVQIHYGCDFASTPHSSAERLAFYCDQTPSRAFGGNTGGEFEDRLHWHNHGQVQVVADLAHTLLLRHGFRQQRVRLSVPLRFATLKPGDSIRLEEPEFPLSLEQGRVETLAVPEPHFLQIQARFPISGPTCWRHDAATFLCHRSSGQLKEFWIEGRLIATLRWDGLWRIRGCLVEYAPLYGTLTAPIQYSPTLQQIAFGAGIAPVYSPLFALDAAGNLHLAGTLREQALRDDLTLAGCIEVASTHLALGIAEPTPVLVCETATARLDLRGQVVEEAVL
ncbi:MAG TPA: phage tail protein [Candidatus Sumerlaeota bacterium]|nr:phage tail protein [Candidatus Sumerlaeota bacterium]